MEAFGWLLRLCDRVLPIAARLRLGEEPIRCSPLSRRCLPLSLGRSTGIVSIVGVPGVGVSISSGCSRTTVSMDVGSMVLCIFVLHSLGDCEGADACGEEGSNDVLM